MGCRTALRSSPRATAEGILPVGTSYRDDVRVISGSHQLQQRAEPKRIASVSLSDAVKSLVANGLRMIVNSQIMVS